jgi:DNA polymerase-3 subunit alpha
MEAAEQAERNAMQVSLFDLFEAGEQGGEHAPQYVEVPRWSERQQAQRREAGARFLLLRPPLP